MDNNQERKPSEIIEELLNLISESHKEYDTNMSIAEGYDKKTITWVHDLELEGNYEKRCKMATAWHKEREERRKHKDRALLFKKIHEFFSQDRNKSFLKGIKWLLDEQKKQEEYLDGKREFKHRVGDGGDNSD